MGVTVIIVNWNSGELLRKCLRHLDAQTVRPDRVIVVDNASTDGSAEMCTGAMPELKILGMKANLGFAGGNNLALSQSDTEFVALLNPDAFPEPDWLQNLLDAARSHPEAAAFGSRQLRADHATVLDGIGDNYHVSGRVWRDRVGAVQTAADLLPREIFSPCAAAALYRRQPLVEAGGFDEDYFCYMEDVDLGFRLRLAGYSAMYVPEAVVHHVGSATTGGRHSDFSVYHGHRNLVWTFVKDMPGVLFWMLLPLHIALNAMTVIYFILLGRGRVILRAKRDAIKGLPAMWRKRCEIQKSRSARTGRIWRVLDKRLAPPIKTR